MPIIQSSRFGMIVKLENREPAVNLEGASSRGADFPQTRSQGEPHVCHVGVAQNSTGGGYAGFGPGVHFGTGFSSHSHVFGRPRRDDRSAHCIFLVSFRVSQRFSEEQRPCSGQTVKSVQVTQHSWFEDLNPGSCGGWIGNPTLTT